MWNISLSSAIVERTTAATDVLLVIFGVLFCIGLHRLQITDIIKKRYWFRVFGFTAIAAAIGAIDHAFDWPDAIVHKLEQFTFLSLGLVIAYFVQGTIHEQWGVKVSERTHKWALIGALLFYITMVFLQGSFILFIIYEGVGMLFVLLVFSFLFFKHYRKDYGFILLAVIVAFIAAIVQATKSGHFTLIWPFDHNSTFHLLQIVSGFLLFLGVRRGLQNHHIASDVETQLPNSNTPLNQIADSSIQEEDNTSTSLNGQAVKSISLESFHILNGFDQSQIKRIQKITLKEKYGPNSHIIHDGELADSFYLIMEGNSSINKDGIELATKEAGSHIGLMPLIDGSSRSANVVAIEETTVLRIPYEQIKTEENQDLYRQLIHNQLIVQQHKLRTMNDVALMEVKQKLQEAEMREEFSKFFISLVFGLVMYQFILGCFLQWADTLHSTLIIEIFTPAFTILIGGMSLAYAIRSMYPISEFGLHLNNWKSDTLEALKWTALFLLAIVFFKFLCSTIPGAPFYNEPVFNPISLDKYGGLKLTILVFTLYTILVPVQELVARAVIQSSLMRVFEGEWGTLKSILLSNLMFSAFHLYLDMQFAILTFIPGIFWGYLFAKQRGLLGVSVSHIIIGCFALFYLNVN